VSAGEGSLEDLVKTELEERSAGAPTTGRFGLPGQSGTAAPDTPLSCPTCGTPLAEGSRFCARCGRALAEAFQPSPEGTITVLFTDIEGSTALAGVVGERKVLEIIRDHYGIVRTCIQRNGGFEIKTQGDGFMVAFASARRAIVSAVDIQRSMARYNRERKQRDVLIRIGINAGDIVRHEDDLFGVAVNLAARIADRANGGQILVSGLVRGLAGPVRGIEYVPRGRIQARGFDYRFRLYEVQWEDQPAQQ
jgi:class 3 adenylate cyclase